MMMIRRSSAPIALLVVLATIFFNGGGALAFSPTPISSQLNFIPTESLSTSCDTTTRLYVSINDNNEDDSIISIDTMNRRNAMQRFAVAFISSTTIATPQLANAAGDPNLFKPNPLTNKALEQLRILNQDEVDNIKYGGELESGAAKPSELNQYIELLQPILEVESGLEQVDKLLLTSKSTSSTKEDYISLFQQIDKLLSNSLFDKINFKKAFNSFADNIYYSDSDRANLYLGGGAEPTSTQSLAYLLRNDILTTVEDERAEVKYLLKEVNKKANGETIVVGGDNGLDMDEITGLSKTANVAMKKYLDLVPPSELAEAKNKFLSNRKQ